MSSITSIEWTDRTWNPVTGCTKVSQGCKNCYAETIAKRFWKDRKFTDVRIHPERLDEPLRWRKPSRIFVNSMSDLFHEDIDSFFVGCVLNVIGSAQQHIFQVLTKRPQHMRLLMESYYYATGQKPFPNLWLGVSVEDQKTADERIPILLQTPAFIRFVSYEPALGPVEFNHIEYAESGAALDWIIVGGESGYGARPCNVEWIRSEIRLGYYAGVPVFVKQLGAEPFEPYSDGTPFAYIELKNRKGGDPQEWPEDLRVREFPIGN